VKSELQETYAHDWRNDILTGGAYSYAPVNGKDLPRDLGSHWKTPSFSPAKPRH
jgi:hypothetical protein